MVNTCSLSVCVHKVYSHAFIIQRQGTTIRGVESDAEPRHKLAACFFFLHFPSFFLFFSPTASVRLELNMSSVFTAGVGKTLGNKVSRKLKERERMSKQTGRETICDSQGWEGGERMIWRILNQVGEALWSVLKYGSPD